MKYSTKLKNHQYCQCRVEIDKESKRIDFISYATRVISIKFDGGKRLVECTGTYSPTTSRQISYFLREYAPDLSLANMKKIIGKGLIVC